MDTNVESKPFRSNRRDVEVSDEQRRTMDLVARQKLVTLRELSNAPESLLVSFVCLFVLVEVQQDL